MSQPPITITILGAAGLIGRRHVTHVLENEDGATLHSIVDPTDAGRRVASELGVLHYDSLDALLQKAPLPLPRAAIIATPSSMHIAQACALVAAGIDVLIEKPLCNDAVEAQSLAEVSQQPGAGRILVGFHRRFNPYIVRLKAVLDGHSTYGDAPLGTVVAVNALWCTRKPLSYFIDVPWRQSQSTGGGVVLTNLSHELDLMRYLFGDISRVFAHAGKRLRGFEADETVAITLAFASGVVGNILLSDAALSPYSFESATGENPNLSKHHQPVYTIMGTAGTINFPNMQHWSSADKNTEGDWTKPLAQDEEQALGFDEAMATDSGPNAPFSARLTHWVRLLRGQETKVNCSLEDGIQNMLLLDAISTSVRTGAPVDL